jgi:hypothetical protein
MLRAVGRATVADLVAIDVVGASLAVGIYRRLKFAAIVLVMVTAMLEAAMRAAAGMSTVAAAVGVPMCGRELHPAQTKHDCKRKNRNRSYDVHDLLLLR